METTVNQRVGEIMNFYNLNKNSFAKAVNTVQPSISKIIMGASKPSFELLISIVENFKDINVNWLLTGEGKMLKEKVNISIDGKGLTPELVMILKEQIEDLEKENSMLRDQNFLTHENLKRLRSKS